MCDSILKNKIKHAICLLMEKKEKINIDDIIELLEEALDKIEWLEKTLSNYDNN